VSTLLSGFPHDLRNCLRSLARHPGFSLVAILSLALAIGFNSAAFSFVDALLLRPFPALRQPDRLVSIFSKNQKESPLLPVSFPDYQDLKRQNRSFSGLFAYQMLYAGFLRDAESLQLYGEMVSGSFFDVLGVRSALGRTFLPADEGPDGSSVVVLSFDLWHDRLSADPSVLGTPVRIDGHLYTVIGVAQRGFSGTSAIAPAAFWVPLPLNRQDTELAALLDQRGSRLLQLVGRLRPGVEEAEAAAELKVIGSRLAQLYPEEHREQALALLPFTATAIPLSRRTEFLRAGALLSGLVILLLLMACVNVGSLMLVRTLERHREMAVRLALGGGKGQLLRQLLLESLVLTTLAFGLGLLIAVWLHQILLRYRPPYFADDSLPLRADLRILAFAALVSLLATVLFGLAPALEVFRLDLISELRGRGSSGAKRELRMVLRHGALVLQVWLCMMCLFCTGLFLRSLESSRRIDPGFDAPRLLVASFDLRAAGLEGARVGLIEAQLLESLRRLPGVEAAGLADTQVLGGWAWWRQVSRAGLGGGTAGAVLTVGSSRVSPEYFRATGIPILTGRAFTDQDGGEVARSAVVNETLAERLWPGGEAVGRFLQMDEETQPLEVVGVARVARYQHLGEPPEPFLYLPLPRQGSQQATLHLRANDPARLIAPVRNELRRMSSSLPPPQIRSGSEIVERSLWAPRAGAVLLSIFGAVAVAIAAIGVFGVAAYSVNRRRFEMGVRTALGARPANLLALVLRRGMALIGVGVVLGLLGSIVLHRWIIRLLPLAAADELYSLAAAATLFSIIGFAANLLPAVRAARVGPLVSMRADQG
jgi:predicted permease